MRRSPQGSVAVLYFIVGYVLDYTSLGSLSVGLAARLLAECETRHSLGERPRGLGKKLAHRRGGAVALAENGRETVAKVQQIRDKPNRNLIFRQLGAGGMRCGCMKKALGRNHRAWGMGGRAFPSYRSKFRMNQKYLF